MSSVSWQFLAPMLLVLPSLAAASSIQINSNCVVGTCPPVSGTSDAIQMGQSIGPTADNYLLTFGNGDQYQISWTYSAFYNSNGTQLSVSPTVTYVGASQSLGDDLITFQYFQNFYDNRVWDGTYTELIPLSLSSDAGIGSTISGQLFYGGQGLGLVGPFGPGTYEGQHSLALTGLNDPTLLAQFVLNVDFRSGTLTGATASASSTATPEPAQALPLGITLLGTCFGIALKRRSTWAQN